MARYVTCEICGRERLAQPFGYMQHMKKHFNDELRRLGKPIAPKDASLDDAAALVMAALRAAKGLPARPNDRPSVEHVRELISE